MEYVIRKCEEKDLSALVELCGAHAEYEISAFDPTGKREALAHAIFSSAPKLFCFIVESGGKPVGYFSHTFDYSTWDAQTFLYLDCLYLEPDFRGFGIGATVFKKLKEIAKENDCVNIRWQTPIFNERAIKFYHGIGAESKEKVRFFIAMK